MHRLVQLAFSILGSCSMRGREGRRSLFYLACLLQHEQEQPRYKFEITDLTLPRGGAAVYSKTFQEELSDGAAEILSEQHSVIQPNDELVGKLKERSDSLSLHDYLELLAWFQVMQNIPADGALVANRLRQFERLNLSYETLRKKRFEDSSLYLLLDDELRAVVQLLPSPGTT